MTTDHLFKDKISAVKHLLRRNGLDFARTYYCIPLHFQPPTHCPENLT